MVHIYIYNPAVKRCCRAYKETIQKQYIDKKYFCHKDTPYLYIKKCSIRYFSRSVIASRRFVLQKYSCSSPTFSQMQ